MDLLEGLNPQQRQAVTAPPGPTLVLAGPGSGKTRVLAHRLAYQVRHLGVPAAALLAVTFTNKAAREMTARVESLLGAGRLQATLGTFHALCARMLRRETAALPFWRDFVIFDEADQLTIVRQALKALQFDPKQVQPGKVLGAISAAKNELIDAPDYAAGSYFGEIVRRVYADYQQRLRQNNALDFDDLLLEAVRLLRDQPQVLAQSRARYPHILVDEFQDTNSAQYALLRLLAGSEPDLFAVGDPDQSIYRWRGADVRNVRRFQEDYPQAQVILLEQNYRSTQTILDAAMAVIDRQGGRRRKQLFTERGAGQTLTLHEAFDEADEARYVVDTLERLHRSGEATLGGCAVMYRTNAQSRLLEEAFFEAGLPYRLVGAQRFYGRREIKDAIAYLRLVQNPDDQVGLLRVLNTPPRGLGDRTVETLLATADRAGLSPGAVVLDLARGADSEYQGVFAGRARTALEIFGRQLAGWRALREGADLAALLDRVLGDIAYRAYLDDGTEQGAERWANVLELRAAAQGFGDLGLTAFLEQLALVSDQDTLTESAEAPTLLTVHAAKGLEFPVVVVIGLDQGVFPHARSLPDPEALAEERRLFYVALTRAQDRLILVRAFRRTLFGASDVNEPSEFLQDLPAHLTDGPSPARQTRAQSSYTQQTRWTPTLRAPAAPRYREGMRVAHPVFGEGIVLDSRLAHDDEEIVINFEGKGVKHLAASLARLQVLEG